VAERTAELIARNQELEQFAYVASHDLQEPLRKVASCCQSLAEDYADQLDDSGREWIEFAVDGAARMRQLVSDLLEFSRVGTHGRTIQPTDAHQACEAALENLSDAIEETEAQIVCRPLPTVLADAGQLEQLFQNLVGNSIKYCSDDQPVVEIGAEPEGDRWKFYVKDNGIGIDPEYHERIFQIFQRLHCKEDYAGTGIGLAICKKVVERFGGKLWVESKSGQGSTFYFTLSGADSSNEGAHGDETHDNDAIGTSASNPLG
jgi:light-regulated signal transduction histidine kinase (bacteriophytochrome)